jgi:hypothetical protein
VVASVLKVVRHMVVGADCEAVSKGSRDTVTNLGRRGLEYFKLTSVKLNRKREEKQKQYLYKSRCQVHRILMVSIRQREMVEDASIRQRNAKPIFMTQMTRNVPFML